LKKVLISIFVVLVLFAISFIVYVATSGRPAPNLAGTNLEEAQDYYFSQGIFIEPSDNFRQRNIFVEGNWKICRQIQSPGTIINGLFATIDVKVVKNTESCSGEKPAAIKKKESSETLSARICKDLDTLSIYQVTNKYNVFLEDRGNGNAIAKTLYGTVMVSCEEKFFDESTGIASFIASWAPEIFGVN
jgi:hypothetical protein